MNKKFWKNKKVLITGHTGFKGSWLSLWLKILGANVVGISLPPNGKKNLYTISSLKNKLVKSIYLNIKNKKKLEKEIIKIKPNIIFHLAAQPLVIESYKKPLNTIETNILGTANLLEASKKVNSINAIIIVTTDKVYKNNNKKIFHTEKDQLGGDDIYSYSKASVEMLVHAYRKSFFKNRINILTVRAGNVIGGGDWSENRLIPDFIKAHQNKKKLIIRNPNHIRPWQHVLDCLYGYILVAEKIYKNKKLTNLNSLNFGPKSNHLLSVKEITKMILKKLNNSVNIIHKHRKYEFSEKKFLALNSNLAKKTLGWSSKLNAQESINLTLDWYQEYFKKNDMYKYSCKQIKNYISKNL